MRQLFQKRFTKNQGVLFTFLEYDGVPWNNNSAEHAIKAFADFRKRMGQSFTRTTLPEFLILLSVWQTCKSKGINFLKFLCSKQQDIDLYKNTSWSVCTIQPVFIVFLDLHFRWLVGELRIPTQSATGFRLKAPRDSDSFRHPIPMDSAMGIRSIPPPPGEGINDAG